MTEFGSWDGELEFTERLLQEDVRNNSAWNQRYFVLKSTADLSSPELLEQEVAFIKKHIDLSPSNPSPWNYLRGLLEPVGYDTIPHVRTMCEEWATTESENGYNSGCVMAMGLLVEVLLASGATNELERARELCVTLQGLDPIRAAYWNWRHSRIGTQ